MYQILSSFANTGKDLIFLNALNYANPFHQYEVPIWHFKIVWLLNITENHCVNTPNSNSMFALLYGKSSYDVRNCFIFNVDQLELLFAPIDTQEVRVYGRSRFLEYCATLQIVVGCSDKCRYFCRYFSGRCDNRGELVRAEYYTLYATTICLRGYANKKAPTLCQKWGRVSIKERSVLVGRFVLIRC